MSWHIADLHFGQENIVKFTHNEKKLRPFDTLAEHDEALVSNWNNVVKPQDKVYVLGDVVFKNKNASILGRLNGKKILIKGNHDLLKPGEYLKYFSDIRAYKIHTKLGLICSHMPIHPECLSRWKANIHGHLHANVVKRTHYFVDDSSLEWVEHPDERYLCVSVEQINFTPIHLDVIAEQLKERRVL